MKVPYITPVVYFGYPNQGNNGLIELASENKVNRFSTAASIAKFFRQELVKSPKLNPVQLQEIKSIVEQVNYLESASHAEKLISKQQANG